MGQKKGNKTPRQNKKKSGKKDLNRKGVEKEGSEMDAFMTEPTIVNDEKERTATPTPISRPPTPPPPVVEPVEPAVEDKIKEELEEREEKRVAAKNEENTALSQEEEPAPVIEKTVPQLTLRHSYSKDQWSPINPEGKKKYDRDFLIAFRDEPKCNQKPENLPDVVAALYTNNNTRNHNMAMFTNQGGMTSSILPGFAQRNNQSQRGGPLPKRGSQGGNKGNKPQGKGMIHMSLSLNEDVKLRTTENAWKPNRLGTGFQAKPEEEKQTEELFKNVRGILNKLTPQKFDTLMKKFMGLPINSEYRLQGVIRLIFEKAVDEPNFSKAYANMCKTCSKLEVTKMENGQEQRVNFRKLLITRCQTEFESNKSSELDAAKHQLEIDNCTDPEKKKELQLIFEEKERQLRRKSVGNIRFIGELFKLGMLTPAIMYRCIEHLLHNPDEESLECLCKLLTTIGKELENAKPVPQGASLNPYFQRMSDLAQKREGSKISSRVRFMLQDVIELRQNKWVPRREDNNPKTIEQINKEAERESMEMTMALNQQPPRMNRQNDRSDDRKRGGNRGSNNNQSEDGWTSVGSRHYKQFSVAFEASKMQTVKSDVDLNSVSLGGSQMFRFNNPPKAVEKPMFTNNTFSALARGDERKPPQPSMNRRITPTPSIERDKERQRMIQAIENDGRSSRGNSAQRDRPQPPSRDSSMPRQPPQEKDNKELSEVVAKEEKNAKVVDEKTARLAEEKLERQTNTIFDEYLEGFTSVEDAKQDIEQIYPRDKVGDFVEKALTMSLEKKAGVQEKIGQLITALMEYNLFSADVLVERLNSIYEVADDIAIDVPKVWEVQAHVVVPIFAAEKINFSHFKEACNSVLMTEASSKLLVPVLTLLAKEKGPGFVRKVWDQSNVNLKDFLPPGEDIDAFIKRNSLEYLRGEVPRYEPSQLPIAQVQEKMLRLMQNNQPVEKIFDFISSNVGDKVEDLQFIRALTTAICEASLVGPNYSLDSTRFTQYEKLFQRYVDNKEDREMACLDAVHLLCSRLEHPQGLIKSIFNQFLDDSLICTESFLKWRHEDKLEHIGVTKMALTSFFNALEEQDQESDDDNS